MNIGMFHNPGISGELSRFLDRDHIAGDCNYKIKKDEVVGRHVVATRNIKPGEVIFVESPVTFGPTENSKPVCLGCYKKLRDITTFCQFCNFPMCSKSCQVDPNHRDQECKMFQKSKFKANANSFEVNKENSLYSMISPIRAFMLKREKPDLWNLVWSQMSHQELRKKSKFWTEETQKIVELLKNSINLTNEQDIEVMEILLGILLVNDFEISTYEYQNGVKSVTDTSIRALFALASMPSHSCIANCTHDFSNRQSGYKMTMRAIRDIAKGEDITHSYSEPLDSVLQRRSLLRVGKFFLCQCPRCQDPTELGTFSSALMCQKCSKGKITSKDTRNIESDWGCDSCAFKISYDRVQEICTGIKRVADELDPWDGSEAGGSVDEFEAFLKKHSKVLHPNHVILIDKKYVLAKMYGKMAGYEPDTMTEDQLIRKKNLCEQVLAVLDVITPGKVRKRGMMMYELHLPLVLLANRALQMGPKLAKLRPKTIKKYLKDALSNLKMGLDILKTEPEDSTEWKIVQASQESVTQLEQWVQTICQSLPG